MPDIIRLVIAWTCVAVFVVSAIITILALLGVIRLPDPKYLNRLFTVLIVAIVGTCASFFKEFISPGTNTAIVQPGTNEGGTVVTKPDSNKTGPIVIKVRTNATVPVVLNLPRTNAIVAGAAKPVPEKGWVGFKHSGAYVAKFYVNWKEDGQPKSWKSGNKTAGYSEVIWLNGNVSDIKITAQAATGLVWNRWATIFKLETNRPPNRTYVARGTTLNRKWAVRDGMP